MRTSQNWVAIGAITAIIVLDHAAISQTASIDCWLDTTVVSLPVHEILSTALGSACIWIIWSIVDVCIRPGYLMKWSLLMDHVLKLNYHLFRWSTWCQVDGDKISSGLLSCTIEPARNSRVSIEMRAVPPANLYIITCKFRKSLYSHYD